MNYNVSNTFDRNGDSVAFVRPKREWCHQDGVGTVHLVDANIIEAKLDFGLVGVDPVL